MDSPLFRPAALTTAVITIVQAVGWIVLSLLGLLTAANVMGPSGNPTESAESLPNSASQLSNLIFIGCYFPRDDVDDCCTTELLLRGDPLLAITIVYLVLSFAWLCVAVVLLLELQKKDKSLSYTPGRKTKYLTLTWSGITCVISLLDFVVTILFGIDYGTMNYYKGCLGYLAAPALLMFLAARGYVLWLLNVAAAVLLGVNALKGDEAPSRRSSGSSNSTVYNSPADAVQDSRSMVFQRSERPWAPDRVPQAQPLPLRSPASQNPPLGAWSRPDVGGNYPPSQVNYNPEPQRGGLAARMTQGPSSTVGSQPGPPSNIGSQRGPPPQSSAQQQAARRPIPEPDYDAGRDAPRRSVLKKSPPSPVPPSDWRQQVQGNNAWQSSQPSTSSGGRGDWQPPVTPDSRGWQGYDNRGFDNSSRQGDGNAGRWGRTGF